MKELIAGYSGNIDNKMIGAYVIVRCSDAGVHAGYLESYNGRECVLTESRRLWYWKPANGAAFLSGVAVDGLDPSSKVGKAQPRIHLTENCEIAECTAAAEDSIRSQADYRG
jgi:hypothetical protein